MAVKVAGKQQKYTAALQLTPVNPQMQILYQVLFILSVCLSVWQS